MVLLCGSTTWTLTQSLGKKLDGEYYNNINNNNFISIALFHVKHAHLR